MELKDLGELRKELVDKYAKDFIPEDIKLPIAFKQQVDAIDNFPIHFNDYTCAITSVVTSNNKQTKRELKTYFPNQWFYIANFFCEYIEQLLKYKKQIYQWLNPNGNILIKDIKEKISNISGNRDLINQEFANYSGDDKMLLVRFLADPNWWGGGKGIERDDFWYTPIMSMASLVFQSQSFVGNICMYLLNHVELRQLLSTTLEKQIAKKLDNKKLQPVIYYGAPGTGKTHKMQTEIFCNYQDTDRFLVTFHQSFSYEEFVEGLKPIMGSNEESSDIQYQIEEGIFSKACERAAKLAGYSSLAECIKDDVASRVSKMEKAIEEQKTVLLCIDELNRGNVASIFGDLISLIEPSKRLGADYELKATLPYSKRLFGVPANLFIVATMNTADRSIQLLDSAIRRRFKFEELLPNYDIINNKDAKKILQNINARIRCLLNKDSQIGHSYLMFSKTNKEILNALTNKIIPLLEEYFYNDITQVRFVLNETSDSEYNFYKEDSEAKEAFELYTSVANIDAEEKSFYSLDDSIKNIEDDEECGKYLEHLLGL